MEVLAQTHYLEVQTHEAPHVPLPDRSARVGKRSAARGCRRAEAPCAPTGPRPIASRSNLRSRSSVCAVGWWRGSRSEALSVLDVF